MICTEVCLWNTIWNTNHCYIACYIPLIWTQKSSCNIIKAIDFKHDLTGYVPRRLMIQHVKGMPTKHYRHGSNRNIKCNKLSTLSFNFSVKDWHKMITEMCFIACIDCFIESMRKAWVKHYLLALPALYHTDSKSMQPYLSST